MGDRNKQIALQFMEAMGTNDPEKAEACLAPDAIAVAKGFGSFSGVRRRETMVGAIEAFKQMIPSGLRFTIHSVTAEGERVVIEAEGNAITAEDKPYRNQYCMVMTFENGKIKRVNEYFCNVLADEVLWPLAKASGKLGAAPS
jgi:ketosteroid isomerase-like protein